MQQGVRLPSLWGFRPSIVRAMTLAMVELFKEKVLAENRNEEVAESA
jgi:hypothetical protein